MQGILLFHTIFFSEKKQEVGDKGDKKIYPYSIYCHPTSLSLPFDPTIT